MTRDRDLVTARVLSQALDLCLETIRRYTREGRIPHVDLGRRQYRYRIADVTRALAGEQVQEEASQYDPKQSEKLTYQDYLDMPWEPGYRFEILDGVLIKEPAPSVMHQRVSRRLQRILEDYFWEVDRDGEIFDSPLDVTFHDTSVVQPDLLYVSGDQKSIVTEARVDGPPTLVVEILSPSTGRRDRLQKSRIYGSAGVQHYWLVNPDERTLECFSLRDGVYALIAAGMDGDIVVHPGFQGLSISLGPLWKCGP